MELIEGERWPPLGRIRVQPGFSPKSGDMRFFTGPLPTAHYTLRWKTLNWDETNEGETNEMSQLPSLVYWFSLITVVPPNAHWDETNEGHQSTSSTSPWGGDAQPNPLLSGCDDSGVKLSPKIEE